MHSPRLALSAQLKNVSNTASTAGKKVKSTIPPIAPKTPTKQDSFITSSPASGKRNGPQVQLDRKQRPKIRAPRTPTGTLFSPTYPPLVGLHEFHQHEPATPTSNAEDVAISLSPLQKSLQDNVARYGHLAQEFDEYDCEDFDPYRFIASIPDVIPNFSCQCLPGKSSSTPPVTLVLDLDETLVHCSTDASEIRNPDFVFHVDFQGTIYTVNCRKRPGLDEFLEYVKNRFEVVVFTASQKVYADKLLDILDPKHEIVHHRVFRDDCTNVEGNYLKDLAVLGRDLRSTIIIDNSPQAFAFQLDNGIPILSWFENRGDRELFKVIPLLEQLTDVDDIRPVLRQRFQLYRKVDMYAQFSFTDMIDTFEHRLAESLEAIA